MEAEPASRKGHSEKRLRRPPASSSETPPLASPRKRVLTQAVDAKRAEPAIAPFPGHDSRSGASAYVHNTPTLQILRPPPSGAATASQQMCTHGLRAPYPRGAGDNVTLSGHSQAPPNARLKQRTDRLWHQHGNSLSFPDAPKIAGPAYIGVRQARPTQAASAEGPPSRSTPPYTFFGADHAAPSLCKHAQAQTSHHLPPLCATREAVTGASEEVTERPRAGKKTAAQDQIHASAEKLLSSLLDVHSADSQTAAEPDKTSRFSCVANPSGGSSSLRHDSAAAVPALRRGDASPTTARRHPTGRRRHNPGGYPGTSQRYAP